MADMYGAHKTYLNDVLDLTADEFGDKVDLLYVNLLDRPEIAAVNAFTIENTEVTIHLVFEVPGDADPQDYMTATVGPILDEEIGRATLRVRDKVAERIEELAGV